MRVTVMTASWQLFICSGQYHWPRNLPPLIIFTKGCHIIPSFVVKACADICKICSVYSAFILKEDLHCGSSKKPSIMGKRDKRRMISPLLSCHAQKREEHVRMILGEKKKKLKENVCTSFKFHNDSVYYIITAFSQHNECINRHH